MLYKLCITKTSNFVCRTRICLNEATVGSYLSRKSVNKTRNSKYCQRPGEYKQFFITTFRNRCLQAFFFSSESTILYAYYIRHERIISRARSTDVVAFFPTYFPYLLVVLFRVLIFHVMFSDRHRHPGRKNKK